MPELPDAAILDNAVQQVLEMMFFTSVLGPRETEPEGPVVAARVTFHGAPSGAVCMWLSAGAARSIAANFLGAEEESSLTDAQIAEVAGEMTNMICGAGLSRLETDSTFDIHHPEMLATPPTPGPGDAVRYFDIDTGALAVAVSFDRN